MFDFQSSLVGYPTEIQRHQLIDEMSQSIYLLFGKFELLPKIGFPFEGVLQVALHRRQLLQLVAAAARALLIAV